MVWLALCRLTSEDAETRKKAAEELARYKTPRAVDALVTALEEDPCHGVRAAAAAGLTQQGWVPESAEERALCAIGMGKYDEAASEGSAAVPPLTDALHSRDAQVRASAARALGRTQDQGAVVPLLDVLADEADAVRSAAAAGLAELGPMALERVIEELERGGVWARQGAREALTRMGPEALAGLGTEAVRPLISLFCSECPRACEVASDAVVRLGAAVVEPMTAHLVEATTQGREQAAKALGRLGEEAVAPLLALLRRNDPEVSLVVGQALAQIEYGRPRLLLHLTEMLRADAPEVRVTAADVLGELRSSKGTEPLLERLDDPSRTVRAAAVRALRRIGGKGVEKRAGKAQAQLQRELLPRWKDVRPGMSARKAVELLGEPGRESDMGQLLRESFSGHFVKVVGGTVDSPVARHAGTQIWTWSFDEGATFVIDVAGGKVSDVLGWSWL